VAIGCSRPGSASAALGSAVVLRMNNMGNLPAEHLGIYAARYQYMSIRRPL
jgi:hypothetical protein